MFTSVAMRPVDTIKAAICCCGQFDADVPAVDSPLTRYVLLVVAAVSLMAFTSSLIFVCWWSVCRRQTAMLHADAKANCPGICARPSFTLCRK